MKLIATVLVIVFLSGYPQREKCRCSTASVDQKTSWGHQNVIIKEDGIFKSIRGRVVLAINEQPLSGVLVEVYDKPEGLLLSWQEREARKTQQRRIAACVTGVDGRFSFPKVPSGEYELRCSKPIEWDPTSAHIIVRPEDPHSKNSKITVPLQASQ